MLNWVFMVKYICIRIQYSSMAKDKSKELSELAFVGFFFIGLALGANYNRWELGALAGLAMGFVAALIVKMKYDKE